MLSEINITARNPDCIRVIQITDTHIFESADDHFDGVNTTESLSTVITHIKQQREQIDLVIVSGDLVHDPVSSAYLKLRHLLDKLELPVFCLPGNHDDPVLMHKLLNQQLIATQKLVDANHWGIILLDTFLKNSHSGRLQLSELEFLEQSLEQFKDKSVLVCLHHPPISVASPWMDAMKLENHEDLFNVLDKFKNVRSVIWGHIHQVIMEKRGDILMYGSPSTCVQFKPRSEEYVRDDFGPAYSVLNLYRDGRVDIETQRLEG